MCLHCVHGVCARSCVWCAHVICGVMWPRCRGLCADGTHGLEQVQTAPSLTPSHTRHPPSCVRADWWTVCVDMHGLCWQRCTHSLQGPCGLSPRQCLPPALVAPAACSAHAQRSTSCDDKHSGHACARRAAAVLRQSGTFGACPLDRVGQGACTPAPAAPPLLRGAFARFHLWLRAAPEGCNSMLTHLLFLLQPCACSIATQKTASSILSLIRPGRAQKVRGC